MKVSIFLLAGLLCAGSAAADTAARARLASCDPEVVRGGSDELLGDPETLRQPMLLFHAAMAERMAGRKERALFFHLAGRLRGTRQALLEGADTSEALNAINVSVGPMALPLLLTDPELGRDVMRRVIAWDRATPDPYRDRAARATDEVKRKLATFEADFARLPELAGQAVGDTGQARRTEAQIDQMVESDRARRCGPGTIDGAALPAAVARIEAEVKRFVAAHAFVRKRAGGPVASLAVAARGSRGRHALPDRFTLTVAPQRGKAFYAEVDVASTVGADRKLGEVRPSLACLTDLWLGQREAVKDVCESDPAAIRPE
ncbi:hypothetical protein [Pseudoduganella albidiflava]|uniref:Uncharacterized protein n=1 Tax=Pseudoduganella albidiflava TaxID=321983 RepID=A0A411X1L3_9BURK|nr:hypothetical protein [Pseudoduganella albidiflava]QBI02755.1 hypothetical protein EYF70_19300 [Pseudoduganella albidiflava]GGY56031.1 hypothetical protein GCM10007387_43090 [Pseudoduganella albidiflava]